MTRGLSRLKNLCKIEVLLISKFQRFSKCSQGTWEGSVGNGPTERSNPSTLYHRETGLPVVRSLGMEMYESGVAVPEGPLFRSWCVSTTIRGVQVSDLFINDPGLVHGR